MFRFKIGYNAFDAFISEVCAALLSLLGAGSIYVESYIHIKSDHTRVQPTWAHKQRHEHGQLYQSGRNREVSRDLLSTIWQPPGEAVNHTPVTACSIEICLPLIYVKLE